MDGGVGVALFFRFPSPPPPLGRPTATLALTHVMILLIRAGSLSAVFASSFQRSRADGNIENERQAGRVWYLMSEQFEVMTAEHACLYVSH